MVTTHNNTAINLTKLISKKDIILLVSTAIRGLNGHVFTCVYYLRAMMVYFCLIV